MRILTLVSCLLAGCDREDPDVPQDTPTDSADPSPAAAWQTLATELGGAVLSVTGTAADDVWMMGSADALGPTVLHYDGAGWTRHAPESPGDLWWSWLPPQPAASVLWAVGAGGRVLRFDGAAWSEAITDPAITLFGVWGTSESDVWTVGGDIGGSGSGGAIFHWDGAAWSQASLPPGAAAQQSIFKVWGTGPDDVWACGNNGTLVHFDGSAWSDVPSGSDRTLLTLHGTGPGDIYVVGGLGNAAVLHWDGTAWTDESPPFAPELNGVFVRDGRTVGVGRTGSVWEKVDGAWTEDPRGRAGFFDLHATWIDPDGGVWAVGGAIATSPLTRGTIVYGGPAAIPPYSP